MAGHALQDLLKEVTLWCHTAINLAELELLNPASSCGPAAEHNHRPDWKLQISVLKMKGSPKLAKSCRKKNPTKPRMGSLRKLWQFSSPGINKN